MRHLSSGENLQNRHYTIENVLGGGGFGVTYLAQDNIKKKQVVIKSLNAIMQGKGNFEYLQNNFVQEALLLAKCGHQNVVSVFDVFNENKLWFMVMEYIEGDDLAICLDKKGALSEAKGIQIIEQIGNALSYVHEQGFLHRDVKPNNILLRDHNNQAILIDFGIAREFVAGETRTHSTNRTDGYAPPEQYEEKAQRGAYTDVYALAATLYHALTNQVPIPANFRNLAPLPPPQQLNPLISDQTNDTILKGMEMEVSKRPQTIQDWLNLLSLSSPNLLQEGFDVISQTPKIEEMQGLRSTLPLIRPPQTNNDALLSDRGINYEELRNLLAQGKWKEANDKTTELMLRAMGKDFWWDVYSNDLKNFPKTDLRTIDYLWMNYSDGQFGFSVQKQILLDCRKKLSLYEDSYSKLADQVHWRNQGNWLNHNELDFINSATPGHLPSFFVEVFWRGVEMGWRKVISSFLLSKL
ncbi:MAG: GUN4 domain-containing protein [Microcystaceae cyanobacterium]